MSYIMGLDLGQANDYTALAVVEGQKEQKENNQNYNIRHLQRFELGTPYPAIVDRVADIKNRLPGSRLVLDFTGVGRPVFDMFRKVGLKPVGVSIHGGDNVNREGSAYKVPKRDLVGVLQVLFQGGRLKVASELPEAGTFISELLNFKVKISQSGNDSYSHREGEHDDLVLAAALACWWGERNSRRRGKPFAALL